MNSIVTFSAGDAVLPFISCFIVENNQGASLEQNLNFFVLFLKIHDRFRAQTKADYNICKQGGAINMRINSLAWFVLVDDKLIKANFILELNLIVKFLFYPLLDLNAPFWNLGCLGCFWLPVIAILIAIMLRSPF